MDERWSRIVSLAKRMWSGIVSLANPLRHIFDRLADRYSAITVVLTLGTVNGLILALTKWREGKACRALPVSIMDLELTFSADRYAVLLGRIPKGLCSEFVLASFMSLDIIFPVAYAAALCALFIWAERYRRRTARKNLPIAVKLPLRNHVFLLLPVLAAAFDILENVLLFLAGFLLISGASAGSLMIKGLVVVGSLSAALKWSLVLAAVLAILSEVFSGSRGVLLRRLRFSVIAVLLGAIPLLLVPQGQDILQRLVEGESPEGRIFEALVAITFAALAVWYCARKLAEIAFSREAPPSDHDWFGFFAEQIPRMLGVSVLAFAGAAFARVGAALSVFAAVALVGYVAALLTSRFLPRMVARIGGWFLRPHWRVIPEFDDRVGRAIIAVFIGLLMLGWPERFVDVAIPPDFLWLRRAAWACLFLSWLFYLYVYFRRERDAASQIAVVEAQLAPFQRVQKSPDAKALSRQNLDPANDVVPHHLEAVAAEIAPYQREQESHGAERGASQKLDPVNDVYMYELLHLKKEAVASVDERTALRQVKWGIVTGIVTTVILLFLFGWHAVPVGRLLGALPILALTVSSVVFYGTIAAWIFATHRVAIASIALLFAALFSVWNDSHPIRRIDPQNGAAIIRHGIATHLNEWRATRTPGDSAIVLVAASGGGLRAAYWTAATLAALQDSDSTFVRHVFAISAVSGGSLGAAVFSALVHDAGRNGSSGPCLLPKGETAPIAGGRPSYSACVRRFMGDDFLSPVLAKMVGPDLLQWFLPFPVPQFDRSLGLEGSWERSYRATTGQSTFSDGLLALTRDSGSHATVPALFLNATHVESGRRYIASPLVRRDSVKIAGHPSRALRDSRDLIDLLGTDIRLSTAVGNSARFTYVSPPGRIERNDGIEYGHLVDGGYFENSGLGTLREIIEILADSTALASPLTRPRLIVLYLCNDPLTCRRDASQDALLTTKREAMVEWAGPIRAVFKTRDARGSLSRADIETRKDVRFLQLNVCNSLQTRVASTTDTAILGSDARRERAQQRVISPPLGWLLSKVARDWMDSSLTGGLTDDNPSPCRIENAARLDTLRSLLKSRTVPTAPMATTTSESAELFR